MLVFREFDLDAGIVGDWFPRRCIVPVYFGKLAISERDNSRHAESRS